MLYGSWLHLHMKSEEPQTEYNAERLTMHFWERPPFKTSPKVLDIDAPDFTQISHGIIIRKI